MPSMPIQDAVHQITVQVQQSGRDDLVEVYNELFPEDSVSINGHVDDDELIAAIAGHIDRGLLAEEVLDLWNVLFPTHKNVWYDEESETVHMDEEPAWVESAD